MDKILIVDIESTHLSEKKGRIVEIGVSLLDLATGDIETVYDKVINEGVIEREKNAWIFQNTTLTYEEVVDNGVPLKGTESETLQALFDKYPVTAFNRWFDIKWLRSRGLNFPELLPCLMLAGVPICKLPFKKGNKPYGTQRHKWPSAEEAYNIIVEPGGKFIEEHRAGDDSYIEAEIAFYMHVNHGYLK